jgi:hypothetical protein
MHLCTIAKSRMRPVLLLHNLSNNASEQNFELSRMTGAVHFQKNRPGRWFWDCAEIEINP